MTVRVTTLKGVDAGGYYVGGLPNYYLDADEPRGTWFGRGAQELGVAGEVEDDAFLAVMAGMDPRRPDRSLGGMYNEKSARGFDVTASAPKSVSVLWALGDLTVRREVAEAHDAAVREMARWIEDHAHTRYRVGGAVAVLDAEGIITAAFRQHTSRALDPQLHTHLVIANRVKSPDGRWLALDARLIKRDQQTLSALYHASLRAELTERLGVRWKQPEHGIAEIADVPERLLAEFSTRAASVARRVEEKLDRFVETMDREPTPRERWQLEREAAKDSRPAKAHGVDAVSLHAQWAEQTHDLGLEPADVIAEAVGRASLRRSVDRTTMAAMVDQAIANLSEKQSSWRPTEILRELAAVSPTNFAIPSGRLVPWLNELTDFVIANQYCIDISRPIDPGATLRKDGRPITESVLDRALTTEAILIQEATVIDWADNRLSYDGSDQPDAITRSTRTLNAAQAEAAAAVAGTEDLVLIVGPAGTGKTTSLAPAVAQLHAERRTVFGIAPSATAAEVLAEETGVDADTLDKLLIEHRLNRPPGRRFDLSAGATVIVDEAGMLPTAKLAELTDLADLKGWRLALVGDPLQFSSVGRGGMFGLLVDTFGAIELDRVHRFDNDWERDASLRLRRGDSTVAEVYEEQGRLHSGTRNQMERAAVHAWWQRRQAGDTGLLMAPTNETADRLNQRAQQLRIQAGELDPAGPRIDVGESMLYIGDNVTTRHNHRQLITSHNEMVRNRATWTIDHIDEDGSITVTGKHGSIHLPPDYVAEHVELAYARTVMGAQGRTVTGGATLLDNPTDVRNLYVAMTRGTATNEAFIVTTGEQTAVDVFAQAIATDWIDLPAHARRSELRDEQPHRPGLLDSSELRRLLEQRHALSQQIDDALQTLRRLPDERRTTEQTLARADQTLLDATSAYQRAQDVLDQHDRPLHRRKHETEIAAAHRDLERLPDRIRAATNDGELESAKLSQLASVEAAARDVVCRRPELDSMIGDIDQRLDRDRRIRTRITRAERPAAVIDVLGERPMPGPRARDWDVAAGRLAQVQAAFGVMDATERKRVDVDRSHERSREVDEQLRDVLQSMRTGDDQLSLPEIDF
ncbi:MAG: conjugal transfer protein [Ilumatobacteraceae bacterium]|nr:conjugal transfer protein [Ilumatobacteraceae bacterium]